MKKQGAIIILSLLLCLAMILAVVPIETFTIFAEQDSAKLSVVPSSTKFALGDEVTITVTLSGAANVRSGGFSFTYDTDNVFDFVSCKYSSAFGDAIIDYQSAKKIAGFGFFRAADINGTVLTLKLQVKDDAIGGDTTITVAPRNIKDASGNAISCESDSTIVTIRCKNHVPGSAVRENKVSVSCTVNGSYDEVFYCTVCGDEISRELKTTIVAPGHSFANYVSNNDATCTKDETETAKCDRCDATDTRNIENSAFGHDYDAVVINCTKGGYTTHTCSRCGDSYIDNYVYMPCGADCGFIIEGNTLDIHGSGDIDNYKTQGSVPWYDYADIITEIIIDEGITKIGNYAFYCLSNLKSIKSKNNNLTFGKYAINNTNTDITVFAENGGNIETYCAENGINYIDPTITPELETLTADSVTVKAIDDYEYSMDGANWQRNNTFTGLSPASEYNIYARYASTADIFDKVGAPLNVTTLKLTVSAPAAPDYKNHTDNSVTLELNALYEFSIDGVNWQKSNVFTGLSKNTIYRFYQRVVETETEYASPASASLIIAIPDKPEILEAGYENILLKKIDGFEYCLDDMVWQESNSFDMLIDNTEYYVYQRLKAVEGEKTYSITSDYTAVITDNSIKLITHIPSDINGDGAVNNKDLTRLFQYLSGWNVYVNEAALDINGDGNVNNKDLTRLFQYLSDWDVEIF